MESPCPEKGLLSGGQKKELVQEGRGACGGRSWVPGGGNNGVLA